MLLNYINNITCIMPSCSLIINLSYFNYAVCNLYMRLNKYWSKKGGIFFLMNDYKKNLLSHRYCKFGQEYISLIFVATSFVLPGEMPTARF